MTTLPPYHDAPALAEAIAQRCEQATLHGDSWQACCPAHDDRQASLSLTATADRVLLHCAERCPLCGAPRPPFPLHLSGLLDLVTVATEAASTVTDVLSTMKDALDQEVWR
jgi:hypothetical protein